MGLYKVLRFFFYIYYLTQFQYKIYTTCIGEDLMRSNHHSQFFFFHIEYNLTIILLFLLCKTVRRNSYLGIISKDSLTLSQIVFPNFPHNSSTVKFTIIISWPTAGSVSGAQVLSIWSSVLSINKQQLDELTITLSVSAGWGVLHSFLWFTQMKGDFTQSTLTITYTQQQNQYRTK